MPNSLQIAPVDFSGWLKPWIDIYKQFIQIISQTTNMDAKLTDALLNIDNNVKAFMLLLLFLIKMLQKVWLFLYLVNSNLHHYLII